MARQGCSALHRAIRTVSGFRSTSVIPLVSVVHPAWSEATLGTACGVNVRADAGPAPEGASRSGGVGPTGLRVDGRHAWVVVGCLVSVLPDRDGARVGRFAPRPPPRGCRYGAPSGRVRHREILDTSTPWRGYKRPRSDDGSQPPESSSSAPSGTASASRSASQPSGNATRPGELVRPRGCPSTSSGY